MQLSHLHVRSISSFHCLLKGDVAVLHRGTPLYGQPAWWGDGDADDQQPGRPEEKSSDKKREKVETGLFFFPHSAAHISLLHLRAVMKVDLMNVNKILPLLHSLDFVVLK